MHVSGQMQGRAGAQYKWSDTWLSADCWGILCFSQHLIHYRARYPGVEKQHRSLFNHVCQPSDFIRAMFRIHLLRFSQCRPMNETILALLKQPLVHVFCESNFWAITQISGQGFWFCCSGFIFLQSLSLFFCISCQSLTVTFNHLQTELGAGHSFSPSLLLGFFPSNLSEWHTLLTKLSIQHWQINWFQWFKSAINVSFPT